MGGSPAPAPASSPSPATSLPCDAYALSHAAVCRHFGVRLLGGGEALALDEFMAEWEAAVPEVRVCACGFGAYGWGGGKRGGTHDKPASLPVP